MAWIESHQSLSRHRKTLRAVAELKVDRHKFLGHLHELWWWGLDNVPPDGCLGDLSDREIAEGAGWLKSPEAFLQAITNAGWIDATPEGRYLHDWPEYAGKYQHRKEANRTRMRSARGAHVPTNKEATDAKSAAHVQRTNRARAKHVANTCDESAEPEERRGEKSSSAPNGAVAPGKPDAKPDSWQVELFDEFAARGLDPPGLDGGEGRPAQKLVDKLGAAQVAACWQEILAGEYGDAWLQQNLSFAVLAGNRRGENWLLAKAGKAKPPVRSRPAPETNLTRVMRGLAATHADERRTHALPRP